MGSEIFWALFWLAILIIIVISIWPAKKFACHQCGHLMKIKFRSDRCANCGTYHLRDGKRIRLVGDGDILNSCDLSVLYNGGPEILKLDPRQWVWPDQCCICGCKPARYDNLTVGLKTGSALKGLQIEITRWTFKVPYCAAHRDGVTWSDDVSVNVSQSPIRMALRFKSYDYWKRFKALNCVQHPRD